MTQHSTRDFLVVVASIAVLTAGIGFAALSAPIVPRNVADSTPGQLSGDQSATLERLHSAGYTGEDVRVGVIDVTGFDLEQPALTDQVADTRAFAAGESVENGGQNRHGTAAAAVVARTAPQADLYLATFDTGEGFRSAVAWMLQQDVDIVVAPVSFLGKPGDGSSLVARAASRAARQGVVFVTATGNVGRGHWQGEFDPVSDGIHLFDGGTRNYLVDPGSSSTRATLWISWSSADRERDFTLELYAAEEGETRLVARSQPYLADDYPNERIVARVERNTTYYVVLKGPANGSGTPVEISTPTHYLTFRERTGSIVAPATARDVVAVGAYDTQAGYVPPFSAVGSVGNATPDVDVVARHRFEVAGVSGTFTGTSAAAAYTAGVATLLRDADPDATSGDVVTALEHTAVDVGSPGVDPVAGHGRLEPIQAVEVVANESLKS